MFACEASAPNLIETDESDQMEITYLFADPDENKPAGNRDLSKPLILSPSEKHPFLTLKHYFNAIKEFLLQDNGRHLLGAIHEITAADISLRDISRINICSEKLGAFYHIASIECITGQHTVKLTVTAAVSDAGKKCLDQDFSVLKHLTTGNTSPYLPRQYTHSTLTVHEGEESATILMTLSEWFEDFHEWHLTSETKNGEQQIVLWDMMRGNRLLTKKESTELFRQVAKILTLSYDVTTSKHIAQWHHAAGDFIVRCSDNRTDVRLTTVRECKPITEISLDTPVAQMAALISFFLDLTIRIRIDRLNGVGETVWFDREFLKAAVTGFFEALHIKQSETGNLPAAPEDFLTLLRSFGAEELAALAQPLVDPDRLKSQDDLTMIVSKIDSHLNELHKILDIYGR
ncbi:MAG: hypothetical protein KAK02_07590 [Desulfobulbaceae bacterium]|nr:hypothetical protein [Desulfobulbaceae bacterium]